MRLAVAACALALFAIAANTLARPLRGSAPYTVILCQFTGSPATTITNTLARNFFSAPGTVSLHQYFNDVSRGELRFDDVDVLGWFTAPMTVAQARALPRTQLVQICTSAAATAGRTVPPGRRLAVVTNPGIQTTGSSGWVLLGVEMLDSDFSGATHETGHSLGFAHSYADRDDPPAPPATSYIEYYDAFDIMSHNLTFRTMPGPRGETGPGMNAYNLERSGWLGRSELATHGGDGRTDVTYTLKPLYAPGTGGVRAVRVPIDIADLFHYYSIELRQNTGWDAVTASSWVSIHEIKRFPDQPNGGYRSFFLRQNTYGDAVQHLNANGVRIDVLSIAPGGASAQVRVIGGIGNSCLAGFVKRVAGPGDRVCTTPAGAAAAAADNLDPHGEADDPRRWRCLRGYVPRRAYQGDAVCVTAPRREQIVQENALAASRINYARFFIGPNACAPGYVWREADDRDFVCVVGATRAETRRQYVFMKRETCPLGLVPRMATPTDRACTSPAAAARAAADNADAVNRYAVP